MSQIKISSGEMKSVLESVFQNHSFSKENAQLLAKIHTESTVDGINSHGINRVPVFIDYVKRGLVNLNSIPVKISEMGSMERWDGNLGSGILNASSCTDRAISLANEYGMGLVALKNTNHWMRGGTYGWQAAENGCIGIMFTNTTPNMPAWGGKDNRIGNNPLVISIPRKEGHVVLDMALSQFSFGKMQSSQLKNEQLPFEGGWDTKNQLSKNPKDIIDSGRAIPMGYWKGSALSMVLDMLATLLSAGNSTFEIGKKSEETGISQIFLCIDPSTFSDQQLQEKLVNDIIQYTHDVAPMKKGGATFYPGEQTVTKRIEHLKEGILVDTGIWNTVISLAK